jgi:putative ABC transport system ATP-binding protein
MLELKQLVKHYRSGDREVVRALDGVSMSVDAGELVALYGPSGSGKSTLLNVIAALIPPDGGKVVVGGEDVSTLSRQAAADYRRTTLGYVNQSVDLIPGIPAIDNATLKLIGSCNVREAHRRVAPLMERLGLGDRLEHRADQLSAGERQRVLIARALATEPRLLLADEPTGNLDTQRSREVLALLTEVCSERNAAMVLVTHDPLATGFANRVHELRDGHLLERRSDGDARASEPGEDG